MIIMPRRLPPLLCVIVMACAPSKPAADQTAAQRTEAATPVDSAASEGRPTVVFLGTSLTAGLGLAREEDTYVSRLAELADSAGMSIHVVNAGVSGDTSADGLARLPWVLRNPLDVLVIELGANDGLRGQDPDALADNLRAIIDKTRAAHPDVRIILVGMEAPPNLGQSYTTRFRRVFPEVARERKVALVPFLLEGVAGVPGLNQADGMHPTAKGEIKIAHNVWPTLERVLETLPARTTTAEGGAS